MLGIVQNCQTRMALLLYSTRKMLHCFHFQISAEKKCLKKKRLFFFPSTKGLPSLPSGKKNSTGKLPRIYAQNKENFKMHLLSKSTIICQFYLPIINLLQRWRKLKTTNLISSTSWDCCHQRRRPQTVKYLSPSITSKVMVLKLRIKHSASPSLMYLFGGMPEELNVKTRGTKSPCHTVNRQQMYKTGNKKDLGCKQYGKIETS